MTFDEWWESYIKTTSIYTLKETTEDAWEAGIQESLRRNREWVGLTRGEEAIIIEEWRWKLGKPSQLCRMVEAKLKDLNT